MYVQLASPNTSIDFFEIRISEFALCEREPLKLHTIFQCHSFKIISTVLHKSASRLFLPEMPLRFLSCSFPDKEDQWTCFSIGLDLTQVLQHKIDRTQVVRIINNGTFEIK